MSEQDPRYRSRRWQKLRAQVIRRDGARCSIPQCNADMTQRFMIHVDHIIEVEDGGPFWDPLNLRVVCKWHHRSKTMAVKAQRGEPVCPFG